MCFIGIMSDRMFKKIQYYVHIFKLLFCNLFFYYLKRRTFKFMQWWKKMQNMPTWGEHFWKTVFGIRPSAQCFIFFGFGQEFDVFPRLKHWLSNYMKHEMFNHVYSCQLVVQRKDWSRSLALRHVTAQTQEPELIAAAWVNACVGFIPALSIYPSVCPSVRRSINHSV